MALQKTTIYKGLNITDAYHSIVKITYFKLPQTNDTEIGELEPINPYMLNIVTEIKANADGQVIDNKGYNMELDINVDESYITQAYKYLKTLDEFYGSVNI